LSLTHLLDTNVVSDLFRALPDDPLPQKVAALEGRLAIPSPVWHELRYGTDRLEAGRRRDALRHFLERVVRPNFPVLAYDLAAADWHAAQRVELERAGRPTPFVDGQIASIAHVHDLTLVTANGKDFAPFTAVRVESWRS
jgi:tRNA(fMet)-specific endonuclease VapC